MLRLLFSVWLWFAGALLVHELEPARSPECINRGKYVGLKSTFELTQPCVVDGEGRLVAEMPVGKMVSQVK
jgi:hypothetical protein